MSIQYPAPGFEPRPLERESPPITTRPGLPPNLINALGTILNYHAGNHTDRDLQFESSHRQFYLLFTAVCIEKTKVKKKEAENCPIF